MSTSKTISELSSMALERVFANHERDLTLNDFITASIMAADQIEKSFRLDQDFMKKLARQGLSPVWTQTKFCVAEFDVDMQAFIGHHKLHGRVPNLLKHALARPAEKFQVRIIYTLQATGESAWVLVRQWPESIEEGSPAHEEASRVPNGELLAWLCKYLETMHAEFRAKAGQVLLIQSLVARNCYFTELGYDAMPPQRTERQRMPDCITL